MRSVFVFDVSGRFNPTQALRRITDEGRTVSASFVGRGDRFDVTVEVNDHCPAGYVHQRLLDAGLTVNEVSQTFLDVE